MSSEKQVIPIIQSPPEKRRKERVAAYCRVSTQAEEQIHSLAAQREFYEKSLSGNSEVEFVGIYADEGISGTRTRNRTQFLALIQDCRDGKVDRILTKSVSRFGRNTVDTLIFTRELRSLGVDVYFEKENLHSISPEGELLLTLMAALAESESVSMSDNIKWGKRYRYKQGLVTALAISNIYGYCKKNGEIAVNKAEAVIVRRIYKEFLDGKNYDEIIAGLTADGVPTRKNATWYSRTVIGILSNEKYCGDCLFQKTFIPDPISHKTVVNCGEIPQFLVEDCVPAIIEKKQWLAAQEMRKRHQGVSKPPIEALPFRSLVFCGTCRKPCPQYSSHSEGRRLTAYHRCISRRDHTAVEVPGMTYVPPHKAGYNYNPTPELAAYRETYKKPKSRPFLCTDMKIRTERFPKAFVQAWNLIVSKKQRYLPSLQNTAATSENPLTAYRAEEMVGLLETAGRLEEFDFSLMIRTLDRVEIMPTEKLSFIFQSGIRITV